jgi:hypothetical protein
MRKKLYLLTALVCGFITIQAGPYYAGLSHLHNLMQAIEEPIAAASKDSTLTIPGVSDNNSFEDKCKNWGRIQGVTWSGEMDLGYANKYYPFSSIDFSSVVLNGETYSYTQKEDAEINWVQPAQEAIDEGPASAIDLYDIRWLTTLNLSGNKFRQFAINGNGLMTLETVNLSNNPTLEALTITGCPQLTSLTVNHATANVSVANCGLPFSALNGFSVASSNYTYAPQGTIAKAFIYNNVDLSSEYSFDETTTTFEWKDGVTPATGTNGVFTFSEDYIGRIVTCVLKNAAFPQFTDGLELQITLKADPDAIGEIATADDLELLRKNIYNQYALTADIDLTEWLAEHSPEEGWEPINNFTGTLDGAGHVISGLWSNRTTSKVGLFGKINGDVEIKNLGVKIAEGKSLKGKKEVGGIVGSIISGTVSIHDCFVNGKVEATEKDAGGIVGYAVGANTGSTLSIQNCYAGGEVSATADHAGGIMGSFNSAYVNVTIDKCYTTNAIFSAGAAAGIIAARDDEKTSRISNCAAINPSITGNGLYAARIIGYKQKDIDTKINNIALADMLVNGVTVSQENLPSGEENRYHGESKTLEELTDADTYTAIEWDFPTVWSMGNELYPYPILSAISADKQLPQPVIVAKTLSFGDVAVSDSRTLPLAVTVESGYDVSITTTAVSETGFAVEKAENWTDTGGGDLLVTFTPADAQAYSATLTLSGTGFNAITVALTGNGLAQPVITADSTLYRFGKVLVGQSATGGKITVTLTHPQSDLDEDAFSLAVAATGVYEIVSVTQTSTSSEAKVAEVTLAFHPQTVAEYKDTLIVHAAYAVEYSIPVSGEGISGGVAIPVQETTTPAVLVRNGDIILSHAPAGSLISIYNLYGQLVKTQFVTSGVEILKTASLPRSIYMVVVRDDNREILKRKITL